MRAITELIGVYHADRGLVGEARFLLGKLLGTTHCGLCDITHSPVRRKREWDRLVSRLGVPFRLYHLNDLPTDVQQVVATHGSPAVFARTDTESLALLLDAAQLDALAGSVPSFARALEDAMDAHHLVV